MHVYSKLLEAPSNRARVELLVTELRQLFQLLFQTFVDLMPPKYRTQISNNASKIYQLFEVLSLWQLFKQILSKISHIITAVLRKLYWLIAPDVMFKLTLRHLVVFAIMFTIPTISRHLVRPTLKSLRNFFLRLTMGSDWLDRYRTLHRDLRTKVKTYEEFCNVANKLDEMDGLYEWKINDASKDYNYGRIKGDLIELQKLIRNCRDYNRSQRNLKNRLQREYQSQLSQHTSPEYGSDDTMEDDTDSSLASPRAPQLLSASMRKAVPAKSMRYIFASATRPNVRASQMGRGTPFTPMDTGLRHPIRDMMEFLRSRCCRNYCGITNPALYNVTRIGTKKLITEFIDHIREGLQLIANYDDPDVSMSEKLVFFQETRHVMGRSALLLSGGASLGGYHFGVCLELSKRNLIPKILCGSSVGSIISSFMATKNKEEFEEFITTPGLQRLEYMQKRYHPTWLHSFTVRFSRLWRTGNLLDVTVLRDTVRANIGDITFLEAYEKTGRILNVTVTGTDANTIPRLLNFLTAPNVVIWSAVIASCAIPFVFAPQELYVKEKCFDEFGKELTPRIHPVYLQGVTFADGSLASDLPMNRLQQLFNVENFIVSQVNPHLVPFLFHSIKAPLPLFDGLFHFLASEFHMYLSCIGSNLRALGLHTGVAYLNTIVSQRYTGDVTIVPDIQKGDYLRLLSNPSDDYIQRCIKLSERSTWALISRLEGMCAMEVCLDECLQIVRDKALLLQREIADEGSDQLTSLNDNMTSAAHQPLEIDDAEYLQHFQYQKEQRLKQTAGMNRVSSFQMPSKETDPLTPTFGPTLKRPLSNSPHIHTHRPAFTTDHSAPVKIVQSHAYQKLTTPKQKPNTQLLQNSTDSTQMPTDITSSDTKLSD